MVDLDGAFAGKPVNAQAVEAMLKAVSMPVQLGGGIRDIDHGRRLARQGHRPRHHRHGCGARSRAGEGGREKISRPRRGRARCARRQGRGRGLGGDVAGHRAGNRQRFEDAGVAAIIFTDIARDGLLKGLNLDATIALAERISIPVIASGGLASLDDVKALLTPRAKKLAGAISGRALYDGRLDPQAALALIRNARAAA